MKITFFDVMKDILLKQNGELDKETNFNQVFSSFMLVRYLSMKPELMEYADKLNSWQKFLSSKQIYKWAYKNIPRQSTGFIPYIKKKKKAID